MSTGLQNIKLINFRSYPNLAVEFGTGVTIIHGANGSGKTNLLEAISLLSPGRGLRSARLEEIGFKDESVSRQRAASRTAPYALAGEQFNNEWFVIGEVGGYKISTGLERGNQKRSIKIDGEKQKAATVLAEFVSCIWLTPQMDGIFQESNSARRQFFDRLIYNFAPEHASRVAIYENAMSERMRLLKENSADRIWLHTLEKRMAEYGVAIAAARGEVIGYLQEALDKSATSFPKPKINLHSKYELLLHTHKALEVEEIFATDLFNSREQDRFCGRSLTGTHRTEFEVINTHKNIPASLCSTGEQKALLLSTILGLARLLKTRKNKTPIILLDEVIAHLDENRRAELFAEITNLGCQTFMTGTDREMFKTINPDAEFYKVENALVTKE